MGDVSRMEAALPVSVDPATLPTLEVDDLVQETEELLVARAVAYGQEYRRVEGVGTALLKNLAAVAVALRKKRGDLNGTGYEYRMIMADIYRKAGLDERIQGNIRYHIGNLTRRTFTPRELERAGLLPTSPLERNQDARATNQALVKAVRTAKDAAPDALVTEPSPAKKGKKAAPAEPSRSAGAQVKATADQLRLTQTAGNILRQLNPDIVDAHMTDGQRAKLDEELAAIAKAITELRKHTRKPRSKA
ncbi:hypothetical protein [Streptomyces hydrogenans]|uniref:hypothetical protein n=1 Tax=Streptomyces hydrogenans TaxID=1873719 RepID=UPI0035DE98CF